MKNFDDGNFNNEVLQSTQPVLVDFWAEWCMPCHTIAPAVESISKEFAGKLKVGKLNIDHNLKSAATFSVRSIPTLLLFKDGVVVDRITGAVPKQKISNMVARHVK